MKLQLLSDLHLETEVYRASPAPGAELLVVAGDVDSTWAGLAQFADWPVPVLFVAGNHEFDGRDLGAAWPQLRERCTRLGLRLLECESTVLTGADGRRVRFLGTTRWSDFELFGPAGRVKAMKAGGYFAKVMRATRHAAPFDAAAVRDEALRCRAWLAAELQRPTAANANADTAAHPVEPSTAPHRVVVITHFAPSLRSADPRYGAQPGTASFCNADDDLLPFADLWLHGHLHCPQDYRAVHARGSTRVVCNPRGHERKGEAAGHRPHLVIDI